MKAIILGLFFIGAYSCATNNLPNSQGDSHEQIRPATTKPQIGAQPIGSPAYAPDGKFSATERDDVEVND